MHTMYRLATYSDARKVKIRGSEIIGDAENARPENDGQRKLWVWKMQEWKMTDKNYGVWKMQDWKMTDKLLAKCEHNYGVWKMQDYKSS